MEAPKTESKTKQLVNIPKVEKNNTQEQLDSAFDIDKLAYAVAMAETHNCTKGYGKTHNNCFGIKHGNTVPCPGVPKMAMCKFETPEESYEAFKIIWSTHYKTFPTLGMAEYWTGKDRAGIWLNTIKQYY